MMSTAARRRPGGAAALALPFLMLLSLIVPAVAQSSAGEGSVFQDQGLNAGEEQVFQKALGPLLGNDNVDLVVTVRPDSEPRDGCTQNGDVYWIYAARGTVCFTRHPEGDGWSFTLEVVTGENPVSAQSATALWTLAQERAAGEPTDEAEPRWLVDAGAVTYPYVYERIVAELDAPRAGDFVIVPANTADRGSRGAHGHPGITQSRSTLIVGGHGARRSPMTPEEEAALEIKHTDIAPTVARALGVVPYFESTGQPATVLNGSPSETALLKRQDGRVLDDLLEPVYNTFVVSIDGLDPDFVSPTLMPNLTGLMGEECTPGGVCATSYDEARAMMITETNGNHVSMITGAYGEDSGVLANGTYDRASGEELDLDRPALNLAETLIDSIEKNKPWLRTAIVMGKEKLRSLFDCTRNGDGECGPSNDNPEAREVEHLAPDYLAGATTSPSDPNLDCPAEPASGSGYTTNQCTMDAALHLLSTEDPDLTFINLPEVDAFSHLFGKNSPQTQAAVVSADLQVGRLVQALRDSGKWQRSTVIVTADHNFGTTTNPLGSIDLEAALAGSGSDPFEVITHGGSASVFLTELTDTDQPPSRSQHETLRALRARALSLEGVTEALYRRTNPVDGGAEHTLKKVHPAWHIDGTARMGELLITLEDDYSAHAGQMDSDRVITGVHGHPSDRHIPFIVLSGGTWVGDQNVAASSETNEGDDTTANPDQAENVDIASTLAWLLDVPEPAQSSGRVLDEAFSMHPAAADDEGLITEPIANRAAIFIFDQNNSVTLWCLIEVSTCGDNPPAGAGDPETVPNLASLASSGLFTRYGSIAAWPTVTMPNHNTVGSGAYPGHHGLVNNRFYDRETKTVHEPIDPQDPDNPLYIGTSILMNDRIETLHEAVHRTYGDWEPTDGPVSDKAFTASVDEPSARGADYATLEPTDSFPNPAAYIGTENPADLASDTSQECFDADPEGYGLESSLDHIGQTQARRVFEDTATHPLPKYFINNFTITDGAGHHFGPHAACTIGAYRDSDKRFGRIIDAMRSAGVLGETLIVVTGDHGGENQDLSRRGLPSDFEAFLNDLGVKHVMTDWHVYLLTTDIALDGELVRGEANDVTLTVTDDDTGEPVQGATVEIAQPGSAAVSGITDENGSVTLNVHVQAQQITVTATHNDYNTRTATYGTG